jgi:hypothetical protein
MSNPEETPMTKRSSAFEPSAEAAIALWVIVGAGLVYGISQTVVKVAALFN